MKKALALFLGVISFLACQKSKTEVSYTVINKTNRYCFERHDRGFFSEYDHIRQLFNYEA